MPFAIYDPESSSWSSHQPSLLIDSDPCGAVSSLTWPTSGSMRSGRCCAHPTLVPHTSAGGSSLLPTPRAQDVAYTSARAKALYGSSPTLTETVRMLPTPTVNDSRGGRNRTSWRSKQDGLHHDGVTLIDAVRLLPTPVARPDGKSPAAHLAMKARMSGGVRTEPTSLEVVVKLLPTPCARDGNGPMANHRQGGEELAAVVASIGVSTPQPSPAGKPSSANEHPTLWTTEDGSTWS